MATDPVMLYELYSVMSRYVYRRISPRPDLESKQFVIDPLGWGIPKPLCLGNVYTSHVASWEAFNAAEQAITSEKQAIFYVFDILCCFCTNNSIQVRHTMLYVDYVLCFMHLHGTMVLVM